MRLNEPFDHPIAGIVESFRVGTSGTHGVYIADQEGAISDRDLFGVPLDGSAPGVRLNPPLGGLSLGRGLTMSADGSRVAFLVGQSMFAGIHSAPTDGSSPAVSLGGVIVEDIHSFTPQLSPDGQWVVFREDEASLDMSSVRSDGSQPRNVLSSGGFVPVFRMSADSTRVVFVKVELGVRHLYSIPIDGSAIAVELNDPLPSGGTVDTSFQITPDGTRVVYSAEQETDQVFEVYSVPIDGSASPVKLSPPGGGAGQFGGIAISSDGKRAVFLIDQGHVELYSAPIDGSTAAVKLSGALPATGNVTRFALTPDGRRVLFLADRDVDEAYELYLAPIAGGSGPFELSEPLVPGGDVLEFAIASDSEHVAYLADQDRDNVSELFSVPLGRVRLAGAVRAVKLSRPLVAGGHVQSFQISLSGHRVVYWADALVDDRQEGFSVPIAGGPSIRLTPELAAGGRTSAITVAPGELGLFAAEPSPGAGQNLFVVPLDGHAEPRILNGPLRLGFPTGSVVQARATADGSRTVYLADQELDNRFELFSVPSDGSAAPMKLNGPLVPGGSVGGGFGVPPAGTFQIGPDDARVAYLADQDTNGVDELYIAPLDGSAPALRLNGSFGAGAGVLHGMRFSPDSSRVVYLAFLDAARKNELYSVPADGSAAPVKLNGNPPSPNSDVEPDFEISPDGSRVVYRSDEVTDNKLELYSVPIDRSAPRTRLNGVIGLSRDVSAFRIDPTGQRVVLVGDLETDDVGQIYSVPIGGGSAPKRLNPAFASGRNVTDFRISPDGARVVYLADQLADDRFELFSVPIDGSSAPVQLDAAPVAGGDVQSFEIAPNGGRVVFLADLDTDGQDELFSAPLDGATAAVKLSGTLAPGGDVKEFALTQGAARVVFRANASAPFDVELFLAPLDGSAGPRRLSAPHGASVGSFTLDDTGLQAIYLVFTSSEVELFRVLLDGGRAEQIASSQSSVQQVQLLPGQLVLHRSDAESEGVIELFSTRLRRVPRPAERL